MNWAARYLTLNVSLPGPVEIPSVGRVVIPIGLRAGFERYIVTEARVKLLGGHDCLSDIEASLCPEEQLRVQEWAPVRHGLGNGPGYGEPILYRPEMMEWELNVEAQLDSLVGLPVTGMWYLVIEDLISQDPGVLRYARVSFEGLNRGGCNRRTRFARMEMPLETSGRAYKADGTVLELKRPVEKRRVRG